MRDQARVRERAVADQRDGLTNVTFPALHCLRRRFHGRPVQPLVGAVKRRIDFAAMRVHEDAREYKIPVSFSQGGIQGVEGGDANQAAPVRQRQALHRRIAEALEQRFPDFVETRPEILAHHYGEAAIADKAITYWHRAGKLSVAKSAVREAIEREQSALTGRGRVLVRASGTEPLIRVMVEAPDAQELDQVCGRLVAVVQEAVV